MVAVAREWLPRQSCSQSQLSSRGSMPRLSLLRLGAHGRSGGGILPASEIATRLLGRAMPNSALLGALSGLTGIISIDALG